MRSTQPFFEIKHRLDGSIVRFECLPVQVSYDEAVIMYELPRKGRVDDIVLPAGSLSFGYFWSDRNYNVYHWVTEAGETLGTYFNICDETKIGEESVSWRDLIIDLLVTPDGRGRILDTEELPQNLDERLARLIKETEEYLQSQYRSVIAEIKTRTAGYMMKEVLGKAIS
jgi:predicted RNA-binding protein associated with RNAse of E/G family